MAHKIDPEINYREDEIDLLEDIRKGTTNVKLMDRLLGCAYGQALGDAYGLSTEFLNRVQVAEKYPDTSVLIPYPDYILTHHSQRWPRGDWTDDTDQWILILDTLRDHEGNEKVFAEKLENWIRAGFQELGDWAGLGLGANVSQVVHSFDFLDDPLKASHQVWDRGGRTAAPNGAVMRCSSVAFCLFHDLEKLIDRTMTLCKVTHFDPRCIASCLAINLLIAYILRNDFDGNNIESLVQRVQNETIQRLGDSFPEEQRKEFIWHTEPRTLEDLNLDQNSAIGYTYKCLASGFYGLRSTESFEKTLNDLIRYGGDADTNGAVCGTVYGTFHGYEKLPYKWLRKMPNKKWLDKRILKTLEKTPIRSTESERVESRNQTEAREQENKSSDSAQALETSALVQASETPAPARALETATPAPENRVENDTSSSDTERTMRNENDKKTTEPMPINQPNQN